MDILEAVCWLKVCLGGEVSILIKLWPYQNRVRSRYLISVSDIVRSNLIVGWKLLKAEKNPSKSSFG